MMALKKFKQILQYKFKFDGITHKKTPSADGVEKKAKMVSTTA